MVDELFDLGRVHRMKPFVQFLADAFIVLIDLELQALTHPLGRTHEAPAVLDKTRIFAAFLVATDFRSAPECTWSLPEACTRRPLLGDHGWKRRSDTSSRARLAQTVEAVEVRVFDLLDQLGGRLFAVVRVGVALSAKRSAASSLVSLALGVSSGISFSASLMPVMIDFF